MKFRGMIGRVLLTRLSAPIGVQPPPEVRRGRLRRLGIIGGRRETGEFPPPMENLYSVSNRVEPPKSRFMRTNRTPF